VRNSAAWCLAKATLPPVKAARMADSIATHSLILSAIFKAKVEIKDGADGFSFHILRG